MQNGDATHNSACIMHFQVPSTAAKMNARGKQRHKLISTKKGQHFQQSFKEILHSFIERGVPNPYVHNNGKSPRSPVLRGRDSPLYSPRDPIIREGKSPRSPMPRRGRTTEPLFQQKQVSQKSPRSPILK